MTPQENVRISRRRVLATSLATAGSAAGLLGGARKAASVSVPAAVPGPGAARVQERPDGAGVRAVVVGAGAFGGWTALHLLRAGAEVTLVDAWGPGNSRASSGGETRVIRATYGPFRLYTEMVVRALELWRENEARWSDRLLFPTGALWMSGGDDDYARQAAPIFRDLGLDFEELDGAEVGRRFPQISPEGITYALHEKGAGYLLARRACQRVLEAFLREGGTFREARAVPGARRGGRMGEVRLDGGEALEAEVFVFAAGPWLPELFPGFDPPLVEPTRQEILYFGTPAGRTDLTEAELPVWVESGESLFYGIPGSNWRGFKVADDSRGAPFDPTNGDRTPSAEAIRKGREYLERRFPAMRGAPLLEARVCQYEQSPDGHLIVDTHPEADNAWIVGGGSGHGFKLGPSLGEMTAAQALGSREKEVFFSLGRFADERAAAPAPLTTRTRITHP